MCTQDSIDAGKAILALERERERQRNAEFNAAIRRAYREAKGLPEPKPEAAPGPDTSEWLTVTKAAEKFRTMRDEIAEDYGVSSISKSGAQSRITKACNAGRLVSEGTGRERRIRPSSVTEWIKGQESKLMDKIDRR